MGRYLIVGYLDSFGLWDCECEVLVCDSRKSSYVGAHPMPLISGSSRVWCRGTHRRYARLPGATMTPRIFNDTTYFGASSTWIGPTLGCLKPH